MRKRLFAIAVLLVLWGVCCGGASAAMGATSGTCGADGDNVTWALQRDVLETGYGRLTIRGTGAMANYSNSNGAPWHGRYGEQADVQYVSVQFGVTSIGNYSFYDCNNLRSATIPNSVTSIGDYSFYGCYLTSMAIPNSVTSIGVSAFQNCTSLTSVTIPNSVTSIGATAFCGCYGLASVTIPNSVTSIGNGAFYSCWPLTSVTIPNSITSIGESVFRDCRALTSVTIPDSVSSIGNSAFKNCTRLTDVYYGGTQSQWETLREYIGTNNEPLLNATIHYTENPVTPGGNNNGGTLPNTSASVNTAPYMAVFLLSCVSMAASFVLRKKAHGAD